MDNPRFADLRELAIQFGLNFFELTFEVVPQDIMSEVAAYGLPIRARHWSYGKVYNRQRVYGHMGLSKIYEIVLNNDPALAFLLDTNPEIANLLVVAHVYAHSDFFKQNIYFADTNRNMINTAGEHALRVDEYIERYGLERVERVMDIAFSVDRHIDFHKGLARKPYPPKQIIEKERPVVPYEELLSKAEGGGEHWSVVRTVIGDTIPPHPEKDILWFLTQYAPIELWERDVLEIIREESYYFFPQFETKIMNEGWATYWHAEILNQYRDLLPTETIDFGVLHSGVVNPGHRMNLNPYYLGYYIFVDIEKRWDKLHAEGKSVLTGRQKIFEVRASENDISFMGNYMTQDFVDRLELFAYGWACEHGAANPKKCAKCGDIVILSRKVEDVVKNLIAPRVNYAAPRIVIAKIDNDGQMILVHEPGGLTTLEPKFAEETVKGLVELWKKPTVLRTYDGKGDQLSYRATLTGFETIKGEITKDTYLG